MPAPDGHECQKARFGERWAAARPASSHLIGATLAAMELVAEARIAMAWRALIAVQAAGCNGRGILQAA